MTHGRTILLADDEPHIVQVLSVVLRQAGYRVFAASDGEEALEVAGEETIDLVISDVQMPNLDGLGLARRLWSEERTRSTPILLLTARSGSEWHEFTPNVRGVMTKPFSPRALVAEVQRLLGPDSGSFGRAEAA